MKAVRQLIGVAVLALTSSVVSADEQYVGGVTWDPDFNDGFSSDFGATASFQQWFTSSSTIGSQTIGQSQLDNALPAGADAELVGVGEFNLLNGTDTSEFVCGGCELTFAFGGLVFDSNSNTFDTAGSWIKVFLDPVADFVTSAGDFADGQDGIEWLVGSFDEFNIFGAINAAFSMASISVNELNPGFAGELFDTNGLPNGSDLRLTASANFLTNPVFSNVASADIVGDSLQVSEPSTVAIFGLTIMGLAGAIRRRRSK